MSCRRTREARELTLVGLSFSTSAQFRSSMQSTTADTTQSSGAAALERLPPELLLRILDELPPQSIVHLSATSSNLRSIARSDIVWKAIVQSLLAQTKAPEQEDGSEPISKADGEGDYYWKQAAFLLPNSQHLGWWISSTPYTLSSPSASLPSSLFANLSAFTRAQLPPHPPHNH